MPHVTIEELSQQLENLVRWRNETVRNCEQRIRENEAHIRRTNRQFDERAMEINRLKAELEPPSEPLATKRSIKESEPNYEGLTDDEVEHYNELMKRKG